MKRAQWVFLFFLLPGAMLAQVTQEKKNTKEESPAAVQKSYSSTEEMLQEQIAQNPKDESAWLGLYKTERQSNYSIHSRKISSDKQAVLDDYLGQMKANLPNTFAYHYAAYLNGRKSQTAFAELEKAYALQPDNKELFDDMLCKAVIEKDAESRSKFAKSISASGIYSEAEMEYNRNVMNSTQTSGVLITYGNVDTYPLLVLQEVNGLRKDLSIVCLEWMNNQNYRQQVAGLLGIDASLLNADESASLAAILQSAKGKKIYLALTIPPADLKKFLGNSYVTGLALEYADSPQMNLETLAVNWETFFQKKFIKDPSAINRNYIIPLSQLAAYYRERGMKEKEEEVESLLKFLATRTTSPTKVNKYID